MLDLECFFGLGLCSGASGLAPSCSGSDAFFGVGFFGERLGLDFFREPVGFFGERLGLDFFGEPLDLFGERFGVSFLGEGSEVDFWGLSAGG